MVSGGEGVPNDGLIKTLALKGDGSQSGTRLVTSNNFWFMSEAKKQGLVNYNRVNRFVVNYVGNYFQI